MFSINKFSDYIVKERPLNLFKEEKPFIKNTKKFPIHIHFNPKIQFKNLAPPGHQRASLNIQKSLFLRSQLFQGSAHDPQYTGNHRSWMFFPDASKGLFLKERTKQEGGEE